MGAIKEPVASLYDADFLQWTQQQAAALRRGAWRDLDVANLVEEIESMGKQQQAEFTNRLAVLLAHLLKWQHQPDLRPTQGRSWRLTIAEQRRQLAILTRKNPSLKSYIDEGMADAYELAKLQAARESGLETAEFEAACPFGYEQAMADGFLPA